ncbi:MAG TPA: triphosphoribosyl-dephospho-CoA synthetase [Planctomycetaceae bacterium]|nr:triphosphoribosyl-dephospho-CoA synthetase [Planctomycetaceae bacterium]
MNPGNVYSTTRFPLSCGIVASLACLWEATAPKPGKVYPGADFEDVSYTDFLTSAVLVGPVLEQVCTLGVGQTVLQAVELTHDAVRSNTNLGILLLLAPLAAVPQEKRLPQGIGEVLQQLSPQDTEHVYQAIKRAQPAGLGRVESADVHATNSSYPPLVEAMRLASERDLIARQYVNNFEQVFCIATQILECYQLGNPLGGAIVHAYLTQLASFHDSLISRKCGSRVAQQVSQRAAEVLETGRPGEAPYEAAIKELDFWLRSDGHRLNPGTSADLIAGGIFVLLRDQRIEWPVSFF